MEQCKVIAITNQKGGVGKTTTTLNLGVGLAKQGKRVMLLDADPQGSLTVSLGIKNPDNLPVSHANIMQAVIDDKTIPDRIGILRHDEGVDLLPSNIELSGTEIALFNTMSRENVLRSYLETVKKNYDYILIDCMPSLGMMTVNALSAADSVIIPSQPSFLSTKGLNLLMRSIARVKKQINPKLRIDGILLTMVDHRTNNVKAIISSIRTSVGENIRVFDTEIPFSVRAAESSLEGRSIFAYDKNGKVAAAYASMTQEKNSTKKRPLGIPSTENKLVQEVTRMILESIYEPTFSKSSHGFRPKRSCHTALQQIQTQFTGVTWFVEGDIHACFDSFDHHVLVDILRERIEDENFIALMWKMLKAGYMEQWVYNCTYSGTPQGSGVSPILANIYLSKLDDFAENLKSSFDTGSDKGRTEYGRAASNESVRTDSA